MNQCFVCNFLSVPMTKGQIAPKKTVILVALAEISEMCLPPIRVVCDSYSKVVGGLNLFQSLLMQCVVKLYVIVRGMPGYPH